MRETELYLPVKKLLEEDGYVIRGEVSDVDIVAMRGEELLIVEMKTAFNLKLLMQAVKRQRMTDNVYIAIPRASYKKRFNKDIKDREYLLRRLSLGLIYVAMDSEVPYAAVVFKPGKFDINKSKAASSRKTAKLLKEYDGRSKDYNTGGSVRTKLVTAYRENALVIAYCLKKNGTTKTKILKKMGCSDKTTIILYNNYYGWFEKTGKAEYKLSESGTKALVKYREVLKHLVKDMKYEKD